MLDGFDEIDNNCQKKATELILSIIKKPIQLYVTTRTHLIDELQDKLFQFVTFGLKPFTKSNQINYLTSFWENDLKLHVERKKIVSDSLREFADKLVDKISESLNDREREFVGIPLQCKMLAENFQSAINDYIKESLKNSSEDKIQLEKLINDNTKFDLTSLYESFMEKIWIRFLEEKAQLLPHSNQYVTGSVVSSLENTLSHLTKLAIKILVVDEDKVKMLWPKSTRQSKVKKKQRKRAIY